MENMKEYWKNMMGDKFGLEFMENLYKQVYLS